MKKSSALALAIAGTMAAPVAMAESGFYMSARLGAEMNTSDNAADEATTFGSKSSRMGWRMETDLGNGMTAYGKYEISIPTTSVRDLYAGLKGSFGDFQIAEASYAAFYNHVTGPVDQPYWIAQQGIFSQGTGRTQNHISYAGGGDAFSFGISVEANGTDENSDLDKTVGGAVKASPSPTYGNTGISGTQIGASIALGDWTISAGMRDAEDSLFKKTNGSLTGIGFNGTIGDIYLAGSFMSDDDDDGMQLYAGFGSFFVNYGQYDDDSANTTPTSIGVGYARSIGRNTTFWAEADTVDSDGGDDTSTIIATLRYDWK